MSYGLKIMNPGNELVLSSDAKGLYCVGKGVLQGAVGQPSGNATGTYASRRTWGTSTYRVYSDGPIVAAIDVPVNTAVSVVRVMRPFAGAWDITCHAGVNPDVDQFYQQVQIDVWGFGFVASVGGYGGAIYTKDGALAYDLSNPYPLLLRGYISTLTNQSAIPALVRPVVLGFPFGNQIQETRLATNRYGVYQSRQSWGRSSANPLSIGLSQYAVEKYQYTAIASQNLDTGGTDPAAAFILEGADLP